MYLLHIKYFTNTVIGLQCLSQFNGIGIKCVYSSTLLKLKAYNGLRVLRFIFVNLEKTNRCNYGFTLILRL